MFRQHIADLLSDLPGPDEAAGAAARAREADLTKPPGALGRLEELSEWCAAWQGRHPPRLDDVRVVVFAGNHGVAARGVSAFPPETTARMTANFAAGGGAVNQLARLHGAALDIVALDLDRPTRDFTEAPAMDETGLEAAFRAGMNAAAASCDLLVAGEMGIANTASAAALACALHGGEAAAWTGPGTGLDAAGVAAKTRVVAAGLARHEAMIGDPLEALRRVGGREIAAIAGAVLGARLRRVPVILDGFVATAAAAVLESARPGALDHCVAGHVSAEPGHSRLLRALGKEPLLDLGMRLGEGSGAAVAIGIVRAAVAVHAGMATFEEAAIDRGRRTAART